jgi:hypothetical protein
MTQGSNDGQSVRCPGCGLKSCPGPRLECDWDETLQLEDAFVDAVLDRRVSDDVGAIGLTVGQVVTIAKWLAPLAAAMAAPAALDGVSGE